MNTRLAGSASTKNLTRRRPKACKALMSPSSSSGRTEIAGTSSQSISMKVGNTGMKNSTATASAPGEEGQLAGPARGGHGRARGQAGGSKSPRWRAGEPCQACAPARAARGQGRLALHVAQSPTTVSPSMTT
jgi:hypothetical protein